MDLEVAGSSPVIHPCLATRVPGRRLMIADHFMQTLETLMSQRPFKPFVIELNTKQRLEVDHVGALLWNDTDAAISRSPGGPLVIFDHESVNNVVNAPAHSRRASAVSDVDLPRSNSLLVLWRRQ